VTQNLFNVRKSVKTMKIVITISAPLRTIISLIQIQLELSSLPEIVKDSITITKYFALFLVIVVLTTAHEITVLLEDILENDIRKHERVKN